MRIGIVYKVHYLFPRSDRGYIPYFLIQRSNWAYEPRIQEFRNKEDAYEFMELTRNHFEKILPGCLYSKKDFRISAKLKLVTKKKKKQRFN